jgi:hypothetical protein
VPLVDGTKNQSALGNVVLEVNCSRGLLTGRPLDAEGADDSARGAYWFASGRDANNEGAGIASGPDVVREALTGAFPLALDDLVSVVNVDGATDAMWLVDAAEGAASFEDVVDHGLNSPA